MSKAAAKTGIGPTVLSAIEQFYPENERILKDDLAYRILPAGMKFFVTLIKPKCMRTYMTRLSEKTAPGIWGGIMCRKRYIDEKLLEYSDRIDTIVNLGAGYDTRAFRFESLSNIPYWEVDHLENTASKQTRVCKLFGSIPSNRIFVAIDFDHEDIKTVLDQKGYSLNRRTFFIWEAVTQYLTGKGIIETFRYLSRAACGSRLAFTYILKDFLDGRNMYGWERGYKQYIQGKVWLFGMEPEAWPDFLKQYGWKVIEDISYAELAEKYVKPTGRQLVSTPIERMVYAEKL